MSLKQIKNRPALARHSLMLFVVVAFLYCARATALSTNDPLAELQGRMNAHLNEPRFAQAQWGVKVMSLATGKTVFEHNADKLMKPASNAKLYTASLALDRLGPDYHIKTSFYAAAKPDAGGTIHGNLLVYGRGDPSFAARFNNGDYSKSLQPIIAALTTAGVKRVEGDLVGDDSCFRGAPFGSEWTWDDLQNSYGAPVSALTIEDNCIDLVFKPGKALGQPCQIFTMPQTTFVTFSNRTKTAAANARAHIQIYRPVGENTAYVWGQIPLGGNSVTDAVSVSNPALWFVTLLKNALAQNGITVTGGVRQIGWLDREVTPLDLSKWVEVASVPSRSLAEIVKNTLKPSQNQYAQLLLLQVGVNTTNNRGAVSRDTESDGLAEMRKFLAEAGIPRGMTLMEEGSGLSRACLVTPSSLVQLLTYMQRHRYSGAFIDALPIAGVDGTLRNRFKKTAAAGNLRAKTGSLGYVDTLSGYLTTKGNDKLVLSIMLNNYQSQGRHVDGRAEIDALVGMLVDFGGKCP
jgi:D-alanyl-D-alanine carboxypeptidase/D-alanyl-D-alanine-endopeptidase (penicillin-binding protein 4)